MPPQKAPQFQVAVARGGLRRRDTEGHERFGMLLGQYKALGDDLLKTVDGRIIWSAVKTAITASGSSRPITAAPKPMALSVSRPAGSPRNCAGLQTRHGGENRLGVLVAGADVASLRRHEPVEPLLGDFQQALAFDERNELLGRASRLIGQSRVPEPPAMIRAYRIMHSFARKTPPCRPAERSPQHYNGLPREMLASAPYLQRQDQTSTANRDSPEASQPWGKPVRSIGSARFAGISSGHMLSGFASTATQPICQRLTSERGAAIERVLECVVYAIGADEPGVSSRTGLAFEYVQACPARQFQRRIDVDADHNISTPEPQRRPQAGSPLPNPTYPGFALPPSYDC